MDRVSTGIEETPTMRSSDVVFTTEQLSQDRLVRPLAMRHDLNTLKCSESKLDAKAPAFGLSTIDCVGSSRSSAFLKRRLLNDEPSPRYCLPMKTCSYGDVKWRRNQAQNHPSTPDTIMSSFESVQSTPRSYSSQHFDLSPPNLNYLSPSILVEHEHSIPANILLPSL